MVAVRIPGADSIDPVAPARDPGVRADPSDFGADIGASMEHLGNAAVSLGAHLYNKQQDAQDQVYVQTHQVSMAPAITQAQIDAQKAFPDGGPAYMADLNARLQQANDGVSAGLAQRGLVPSKSAQARVNTQFAGMQGDALVRGVVYSNNQKVTQLQTTLNDNVDLVKSQVLSGNMSLDDGLKNVESNAASGKSLWGGAQLVDQKDKWQQGVIDAAIESKTKAGDLAGAQAIKDKYYGRTPKFAGGDNLPAGIGRAVDAAAFEAGLDPMLARRIVQIESGGNPSASTGKYKGLFQLSDEGFAQHGGKGNIFDPNENISAGVRSLKADADAFRARYGRDPSATELYLSHQQGQGGLAAQLANPEKPAWQNMASTGEGRAKGEAWSKLAIWGNIPDADKAKFGSVDNVSGKDFVSLWQKKIEGGTSQIASTGGKVRLVNADGTGISGTGQPNADASGATADNSSGDNAPVLPNTAKSLYWDQQFHAAGVDQKQAEERQQKAIKTASDNRELEIFKDIHSNEPKLTAQQILNDPQLTKEAVEKLYNIKVAPKNNGEGYGTGYVDLFQRVHLPAGDPQRLSDPAVIYPMANAGGPLTPAGAEKLVSILNEKKTLEGQSREAMKSEFLKSVKMHITGEDLGMGLKDPNGERLFANYMVAFDKEYQKGIADNKSPGELLSGDGPLFKLSEMFRRNQAEWYSQIMQDNPQIKTGGEPAKAFDINTVSSLADLVAAYNAGKVSKAQADQLAIDKFGAVRKAPAASATVQISQ